MNHAAAPPAAFTASLPAESVPPPARRAQRVRRTPAQKAELIARFEASGLKVAEFCRRQDLSPASFYLWRREAAAVAEPTLARLLRVQTPEGPTPAAGAGAGPDPGPGPSRVTARLRNGVELCVGVEHLNTLVKAVASC